MHSNSYVTRTPAALAICKLLLLAIAQLPLISAAPTLRAREAEPKPPDDPSLWLYLGVAAALVLSGGAFAGLTIALMGQDEIYLQVIKTSGEGSEKKNAATVLNLLKKGKHWVLVTLLLSNVITNETLPIVLDRSLGGGWPAVLGSTVLIVIFGEIVPQSICVRYGLPIGAWMAPCVLTLMYLMSPVAWPIAKLLDRLLGEDHGTIYKKAGLKTLVTLHKNLGQAGEQLNSDEVTIISAVLDLKEKPVGNIMIPMEDVFTMSVDDVLDEKTMDLILSQGYSRIPIHAADNEYNFVGMLLVKMLITYDPEDCKLVRDFALATLPETRAETSCLDIVNFFQEGKSHMVLVSEYPGEDHGALGVVTLEDVIEELIGEEIIDESDVFIDVHKAIRRMTPAPKSRVPKGKIVAEPPEIPNPVQTPLNEISNDSSISRSSQTESRETPQQKTQTARYSSPPQPTFYLRKSSTFDSGEGSDSFIIKRGPTPEIREHLKHLGPSNLASRPRQTRYNSVKIKPGNTSPTRFNSTPDGIDSARPSSPESRRASETASLLSTQAQPKIPGGAISARGGVRALKASYGAMADRPAHSSEPAVRRERTPEAVSRATSAQDEELLEPTPRSKYRGQPSGTLSPRIAEDSRGSSPAAESMKSNITPAQGYRLHGPTRSGSITEQIIDANGIRKVILQTGSGPASEDENIGHRRDDGASPGPGKVGRGRRRSREEDQEEQGPSSKGLQKQAQTPKKKSRRKKRGNKQGGGESKPTTSPPDDETRPLLDR